MIVPGIAVDIAFDLPWALLLLPLAVLPLAGHGGPRLVAPWLGLVPADNLSRAIDAGLRVAGATALAALVVAIAGPYRPEYPVPRTGRGAEVVILLDRSRSMDLGFGGGRRGAPRGTGPEAIEYYMRQSQGEARGESKGHVARRVLAEFAAGRPDDRFGLIVFSSLPMPVLAFTQKPEVIQAAIAAGDIGRGLSETDIGLALRTALGYFEDRPYTGSRIVMLVSDGGDHLTPEVRQAVAEQVRRLRVALYWIYIRSARSPGLEADVPGDAAAEAIPEVALNRAFRAMGVPYRAYEAEDPESLQRALADVNRLENLPIDYFDVMPRRDGRGACLAVALAAVLVLLGASTQELRRWA